MTRDTDLFAGLGRPDAPPGLEERALAAAYQAAAEPDRTLTDRLWEHRGLRLIWAGLVAVFLPINIVTLIPTNDRPETLTVVAEPSPICGDSDLQQLIDRHPTRKKPTHASVLPTLENLLSAGTSNGADTTPQGDTT